MRNWMIMGAATLALAGCVAPNRPNGAVPIEGDSITYETGPCYGRCPVYGVTVRPDGTGVFEGKQHTTVTGARAFRLSKAEYDAFAARLAPYRPEGGEVRYEMSTPNCGNAPTDMPSVEVRWTRAIGDMQKLHFYYGCRRDNAAMAEALGGAAELLPIGALIGPRP